MFSVSPIGSGRMSRESAYAWNDLPTTTGKEAVGIRLGLVVELG